MSDIEECCLTCRFWTDKEIQLPGETQTRYFCRRFPPVPGAGFPETAEDDWCGEWDAWEQVSETE